MDNKLEIIQQELIVIPQGLDKVWAFKNKLTIPLDHILGATVDRDILNTKKGLRGPGLEIPNKWCGTWSLDGEKHFWNVTRKETPIVIQLKDEHFSRLILGVDNGNEWVDKLNNLVN